MAMKQPPNGSPFTRSVTLMRAVLAVVFTTLLLACGGGGVIPAPEIRPLPADFFARKAVAYSPFRTAADSAGRETEVITPAMIKEDLDLLVTAGFGLIRLFDSSDKVARQTLQVIREHRLDLEMMLGIWVQGSDGAFNNAEIARGIALANEYPDIVAAVSVGNEAMVSWSGHRVAANAMRDYIVRVRAAINQPVTTDDNWAFFAKAHIYEQDPRPVLDVVDFVAMHTYPLLDTFYNPDLWDWKQLDVPENRRAVAMMDAALERARFEYDAVRANLDRQGFTAMPIIIGETGWTAVDTDGDPTLTFRAHPVNQKMYFDRLQAWKAAGGTGPKNVVYFEAFDEPWKQGDDGWGLFNVQRQVRFVVQGLFPDRSMWEPVNPSDDDGIYTESDAVFFIPPVITPAVTESRYLVYTETTTASDYVPTGLVWDPFVKTFWQPVADPAPGDGSESLEIDPRPEVWGWGMLYQSRTNVTANLSNFAGGSLNFSLKTTYAGKLEIGISSETEEEGAVEAYVQIENGRYGHCNTGQWCAVSIPLQDFVAVNPKIDLRLVLSRFILADRYEFTGNTPNASPPKVLMDGVYWSR
jgi:exo-beta-1,3-glucanase (GH17 family)